MSRRIRGARLDDEQAIRILEDSAFAHPWSSASIQTTLRDPLTRVWIVAAISSNGRSSGSGSESAQAWAAVRCLGDEAELLRIATHPEQRRQGRARQLLDIAWPILSAAGIVRCHLEVRADNAPALALYSTFGFQQAGRRRGYYRDGTDALTLTSQLVP